MWVFNREWILNEAMRLLIKVGKDRVLCDGFCDRFFDEDREDINKMLFFEDPVRLICPINPFHLNQRLR